MPRHFASVALGVVGLLALPATGIAATTVVGSDLSHPADTVVQHGADTAVWNVALGSSGSGAAAGAVMPSDGQITTIRLKGTAHVSPSGVAPLTQIHFQDLVPQPDGSVKVDVTTGAFDIPTSGDPNRVSEFHPENFCVHRGDYVAFNDEGGFDPNNYPNGVAYQVLARVPGSVADEYTKDNGTKNGAQFTGSPLQGEELLVQEVLATGPDATPLCPGGTQGTAPSRPSGGTPRAGGGQPGLSAVTVPLQTDKVNRQGFVQIALVCNTTAPCDGSLTLGPASSGGSGASSTLGTSSFHLQPHQASKVKLQLTRQAQKLLRHRHGRATRVKLTVSSGTGGAPVSTTSKVKLKSGH
ncbi:MAG TPA: hypothetical protein VGY97_08135 [Solirubrobacteraceae bacterium]|nr:hypothetical protein [Solirubrobacteraceae bacterium]